MRRKLEQRIVTALVLAGVLIASVVLLPLPGLAVLFGLQAFVNFSVAIRLLPAKGMTLPFISYGGSSMLALALGAGLMLALTRRRPGAYLRA